MKHVTDDRPAMAAGSNDGLFLKVGDGSVPRSRNIKPGFFKNEHLAEQSPHARLLFAGLWTLADARGLVEDRPKRIKAEIFPYEDVDVDSLLAELHTGGFIVRYVVGHVSCIAIPTFQQHQHPHPKEQHNDLPDPPEASREKPRQITDEQRQEIAKTSFPSSSKPSSPSDSFGPCTGTQASPGSAEAAHGQDMDQKSADPEKPQPPKSNPKQPVRRLEVALEDVAPIARRIFKGLGYRGDQGQNLWKIAAAFHAGKISEHAMADPLQGVKLAKGPIESLPGWYYTAVVENVAKAGADLQEILNGLRIVPNLPTGPPEDDPDALSIAASVAKARALKQKSSHDKAVP